MGVAVRGGRIALPRACLWCIVSVYLGSFRSGVGASGSIIPFARVIVPLLWRNWGHRR